ncbi:disease resistance RPP13-like protein 1 [Populus alba x Populus x berolinensis]|uniref:Disease resistance RPP13-like protein 1 n=1 Tax=Populus alba x Populus x berolinensis TaxID=444605 RepID=A0AAD6RJ29_9ROSI|nr:disease resistance RPP13-like protein 1 [Populus alba x Populus x berolinensis]
MAAALVGGPILSAFLQVLFDRMASREVLDFFKERNLNERLLKKLKIMMISVNGVLDDAEEKQVTKPAVKEWLDELKDAVYEADDLLDEIAYEALRVSMSFEANPCCKSKFFLSCLTTLKMKHHVWLKLEWQFWRDKADHLFHNT